MRSRQKFCWRSVLAAVTVFVAGAWVYPDAVLGATFYVSPSGNDNNTGVDEDQAWLTLQKAGNTLVAGDVVLVSGGTYAGFDVRNTGTSENPITFKANGGGVVITGSPTDLVSTYERNYIVIDGFVIEGAT